MGGDKQVNEAYVLSQESLEPQKAKWIRLTSIKYKDPAGRERFWESAERATRPTSSAVDGVGIVAILEDRRKREAGERQEPRILLQKQFRPAVGRTCIEVPAGLVDAGETAEQSALRELKEETGYVGEIMAGEDGISPVMWNDPGFCNTNLNMLHVTVDTSKPENANPKPELEEGEFIECFTLPLRELFSECKRLDAAGYAIDARVGTLAEGLELARRFAL